MFCRNCGKEIPNDTKFCNHCGAAQDSTSASPSAQPAQPTQSNPQYQAPLPPTAPKKNPMMLIIIAAVVVVAVVIGMFVIAPAISGNKGQTQNHESSITADNNNNTDNNNVDNNNTDEIPDQENGNSNEIKPPVDGAVVKYKNFEIRRADNDYCTVFLRYRENSDYVAEVTFLMKVPTDFSDYQSILSDNKALESKISSENISTSLIEFADVELADGLEVTAKFNKLDEGNPNIVALVEEYVDLPAQNGYLKISDCEQFLLNNGFKVIDQN